MAQNGNGQNEHHGPTPTPVDLPTQHHQSVFQSNYFQYQIDDLDKRLAKVEGKANAKAEIKKKRLPIMSPSLEEAQRLNYSFYLVPEPHTCGTNVRHVSGYCAKCDQVTQRRQRARRKPSTKQG